MNPEQQKKKKPSSIKYDHDKPQKQLNVIERGLCKSCTAFELESGNSLSSQVNGFNLPVFFILSQTLGLWACIFCLFSSRAL